MALFRWNPSRSTFLALGCAVVAIGLSFAMIPLRRYPWWMGATVRDGLQICVVGFVVPLVYFWRTGEALDAFGLTLERWHRPLLINIVIAALLCCRFLLVTSGPLPAWSGWTALYVFEAVFFELVFFYAFLRTLFERAFGVVPALVLVALAYSLHHAGFQPEYGKLYVVGLGYATVYRLAGGALAIYPFALGVGALYDVLFRSRVVARVDGAPVRAVLLGLFVGVVLWSLGRVRAHARKHSHGSGAEL